MVRVSSARRYPDLMLRLVLVRHGAVPSNARLGLVGRTDEELTPEGVRQAEALASALGGIEPSAVVSSPLARCVETGRRIAEVAGLALATDRRLIEQDYGDWEGLTRDEVVGLGPQDAERMEAWWHDPTTAPPGGESLEDVARRAGELVEELHRRRQGDGPVVLVSHVGPIKSLISRVLGLPLADGVRRFFLDPGAYSVADWGVRKVLRVLNARGEWPLTRR